MASISVVDDVDLEAPMLVEGFPGVGLVGTIAVDHLVETFEMTHYANVHCEGLPRVTTYAESDPALTTPVRLYADEDRNLVALQSDVPVKPEAAVEFAECFSGWIRERDATPIYLSGLGREKDAEPPELYGVATGGAESLLAAAGIEDPPETGLVAGPTGALLADALERDDESVGLIVEADPNFPDPEAARILIAEGIDPLAGTTTPVEGLVEQATAIRERKERVADPMEEGDEKNARAEPLRMYQ